MYIVPGLALLFVVWTRIGAHADVPAPVDPTMPVLHGDAPPVDKLPVKAETVTVGLYLQNIPDIDIKTNSFTAEIYLWFRWNGSIDPTQTFQITNAVNVTELTQTPIYTDDAGAPKAELMADGAKLQTFHIYGRFGHPFPLARYPFDDHDITISIEDTKHREVELVHAIDNLGAAIRPDLIVPGWTLGPMHWRLGHTAYASTFGDTRSKLEDEHYSRVDFTVHIERPVVGIVSKTVIPIALILLITFGAFFCQPGDIDARLCLTITALISAVALQITANTELPSSGSLLLLDKIYIVSYATILAVTFCCIRREPHGPRRTARTRTQARPLGTARDRVRVLRSPGDVRREGQLMIRAACVLMLLLGMSHAHADAPATPTTVTVGVFINHVYGIDIKNNQFNVDFYIWFRWQGDPELKPVDTFELSNGRITSRSGISKRLIAGQNYVIGRIVASITKFWDLRRFPLDDHTLELQIEDSEHDTRDLVYVADAANATISPELQVSGWIARGSHGHTSVNTYHTNYGDISLPHDRESVYSRYIFGIEIERPGYGRFVKVFFGLFIAVLISWCSFFVRPKESSPRVSLGVGATFAAAAVTVAINNSLPDTNAVTMADKLIMLTLGIIVASVAETIIALALVARGKESIQQRMDRICAYAFPAFYLGMLALIVA